jgi:hypothetical protein
MTQNEINSKHNEINFNLGTAVRSGKYCLAVFHLDETNTIHLWRYYNNFGTNDLSRAVDLFSQDVMKAQDFNFVQGLEAAINQGN